MAKKKVSTGKFDDAQKVNLRDLLEVREKNPFGTTNEAEFSISLDEMFLDDLRQLAAKAGVSNSGSAQTLKANLKQEFKRFATKTAPINFSSLKDVTTNKSLAEKVDALLNQ